MIIRHSKLALFLSAALAPMLWTSAGAAILLDYDLDEGTGTTVFDTGSAPAANGTFSGAGSSWVEDSPSGSGFSYNNNGAGSFITAGEVSKIGDLGDFTITFWAKLSGVAVNDRIFSTRGTTTGPTTGFMDVTVTNTDAENLELKLEMSPGSSLFAATSDAFDATEWVFFAIVRDTAGTGTVQFYSGGTVVGSGLTDLGSTSGMSTSSSMNQNAGNLELFGTQATANDRTPSGSLSGFRIYDEALSSGDLNSIRITAIPEPSQASMFLAIFIMAVVGYTRRRV